MEWRRGKWKERRKLSSFRRVRGRDDNDDHISTSSPHDGGHLFICTVCRFLPPPVAPNLMLKSNQVIEVWHF